MPDGAESLIANCIAGTALSAADDVAERRLASRILADAFGDYPISTWLLRNAAHPDRARVRLFEVMLDDLAERHATIEIIADGVGASVWLASDQQAAPTLMESLRPLLHLLPDAGLRSAARLLRMERVMATFHTDRPHVYLFLIGVRPERQGRGFGSLLLRSGLAKADAARRGVFLETSSPANIPLYEHFGFEVCDEYLITRDSPPTWTMWRRPSATSAR